MDVNKDDLVRSKIVSALPREIDYAQWCDPSSSVKSKAHFKSLLDTFYECMLQYVDSGDFSALESQVNNNRTFYAPYVIEGAGMAFCILFRCRYITVGALDSSYFKMNNINRLFSFGVGMGLAFLGVAFEKCCDYAECLNYRAIKDGYGFYSGIRFRHRLLEHGADFVNSGPSDFGLWSGYGRSLWFANASNPEKLFNVVQALPQRSRISAWRGVGLAAIFTGGGRGGVIKRLSELCKEHRHHLADGAQYGLYLRGKAHENYPYVQEAKAILCKPLRIKFRLNKIL